ncbi:LOW QUALITY PROTEIN: hypothetical protein ACHAWF_005177, partial [Thalassiosira exigua]
TQQWIATNPKIAGYKAEEAFPQLWKEQKELFYTIETKSWGRVFQFTKSGFECAKRAKDLLMHMQRMHEQRLKTAEEGEGSDNYNSDIHSDTGDECSTWSSPYGVHGGTKASVIRDMCILDLMKDLHRTQSREVPEWHGTALSKVQPNLWTYKRRKGDNGPSSVEHTRKFTALMDWMELMSLRGWTAKIRSSIETYQIVLSAWVCSHHMDAPREADGILYRMIRLIAHRHRQKLTNAKTKFGTKTSSFEM